MPKRTTKPLNSKNEATPKLAKQGELTGIEKPNHPELDTLMEEHASLSEELGTARQRIGELNVQLEQEATKLGVTTYRHPTAVPELVLTVTEGKSKVKVKKAKGGDDSEADDE